MLKERAEDHERFTALEKSYGNLEKANGNLEKAQEDLAKQLKDALSDNKLQSALYKSDSGTLVTTSSGSTANQSAELDQATVEDTPMFTQELADGLSNFVSEQQALNAERTKTA